MHGALHFPKVFEMACPMSIVFASRLHEKVKQCSPTFITSSPSFIIHSALRLLGLICSGVVPACVAQYAVFLGSVGHLKAGNRFDTGRTYGSSFRHIPEHNAAIM